MSAEPMPRPWLRVPTQTGATPATGVSRAVEAAGRCLQVAHDRAALVGHELNEGVAAWSRRPGAPDDGQLLLGVARLAVGERVPHDGEDARGVVGRTPDGW